ncbi:hypothetical protein D3C71_1990150 [compost metagenome]
MSLSPGGIDQHALTGGGQGLLADGRIHQRGGLNHNTQRSEVGGDDGNVGMD